MRCATSLPGRRLRAIAGALALTGLVPLPAAAQRPLHGVVADAATLALIDSAKVAVVGTGLEALTGADGAFTFDQAPVGPVAVRIEAPGYPIVVEPAHVTGDAVLYMQVLLPAAATILGELLPAAAHPNAARTAAEMVAREVLDVNPNSGNLGWNVNPVLLRGTGTIRLNGEPEVFLDGVRLGGFGPAMEILSRIPASDVKSMDVLRGPASGFLQGSANGSIHIRTRSGPGGSG